MDVTLHKVLGCHGGLSLAGGHVSVWNVRLHMPTRYSPWCDDVLADDEVSAIPLSRLGPAMYSLLSSQV